NCQAPVPNVVSSVLASDNCTPVNALQITQNPTAGTLVGTGPHTITVTVTDASGNSTSGSVPLSVVDTTAPSILSLPGPITAPVPSTASLAANCQAAVPNVVASVVASDNCTPANALQITQNPAAGTLVGAGPHTITVTVTDASGNSSTGSVLFTVVDSTAPSIL